MYLTPAELKTVLYAYQVDSITESDATIAEMAIAAAISETKGYLPRFDTAAIFAATGTSREPLLLEIVKDIAVWRLVRLSNMDIIYQAAKDRYDRAVKWLQDVQQGKIVPAGLPALEIEEGVAEVKNKFFSNPKFHSYGL